MLLYLMLIQIRHLLLIPNFRIEGLNETEKEKTVISDDCELVTLLTVIKGRFEVTTSDIYFLDLSPLKEEGNLGYRS